MVSETRFERAYPAPQTRSDNQTPDTLSKKMVLYLRVELSTHSVSENTGQPFLVQVVATKGIEPLTQSSSGFCSTRLSYVAIYI